MKRIALLSIVSTCLLINTLSGADMGISKPNLLGAQASSTLPWTAELQALGLEFISAAHNGKISHIQEMLIHDPLLVNFKNDCGNTLLIWAVLNKYTVIVDILIAARADVDAQDDEGRTSLMTAASMGSADLVKSLIAANANINIKNHNAWTALMIAARWGRLHSVQTLLAARADITIKNNDVKTALELAKEEKNTQIVELLQNHVDIEPEEETLMVKPAVDYMVKESHT